MPTNTFFFTKFMCILYIYLHIYILPNHICQFNAHARDREYNKSNYSITLPNKAPVLLIWVILY